MWLVDEHKLLDRGEWRPPHQREAAIARFTPSEWAAEYVESRTLAPSISSRYLNESAGIAPR